MDMDMAEWDDTGPPVPRYMAEWDDTGEPDIYVDERGVLYNNKSGELTREQLREQQAASVGARAMALLQEPVPLGGMLIDRLKQIHKYLFEELYPWAGELRTISMRVPAGADPTWGASADGASYAQPGEIKGLLEKSKRQGGPDLWWPANLGNPGTPMRIRGSRDEFLDGCTQVYEKVHYARPFRVGNETTVRFLLGEVARASGRRLDMTGIKSDERYHARLVAMRPADSLDQRGNGPMRDLFDRSVNKWPFFETNLDREPGLRREVTRRGFQPPQADKRGRPGGGRQPPGRGNPPPER